MWPAPAAAGKHRCRGTGHPRASAAPRRRPLAAAAAAAAALTGAITAALVVAAPVPGRLALRGGEAFAALHRQQLSGGRAVAGGAEGGRRRLGRRAGGDDGAQVVDGEADEEAQVWQEAYNLEADRAELIQAQLKAELEKLGEASEELLAEFEGCMVDLEPLPERPESEAAAEWAEAYSAIRRCNEQSELRLTEMRSKLEAKTSATESSRAPQVVDDYGPIRHQGIRFKGISFPRFGTEEGSSVYFVELPMPLGLKLEERTVQPQGSLTSRAVEVVEVLDGGSAARDGRVKAGDYLRCITVPKRKINADDEMEGEAGGSLDGISAAFGVGGGKLTKALLVIPTSSSFPFERVLEDIQKNKELDGYVAMVLERPLR